MIHLFVEILDRYFGNVCELDIIFNFHKASRLQYDIWWSGAPIFVYPPIHPEAP